MYTRNVGDRPVPFEGDEASIYFSVAEFAGLLTAVRDLAGLRALLSRKLRWLLDFETASLAVHDDSGLSTYQLHDLSFARIEMCAPMRIIPLGDGWAGRALIDGKPIFVEDLMALPVGVTMPPHPEHGISVAARALTVLPLCSGQEIVGALALSAAMPLHTSPTLRTVAALLAAQIGGQLGTIRAYDATTRALETLRGAQAQVQTLQQATETFLALETARAQEARLTAELAYSDSHDPLTGLLTRIALCRELEEAVSSVQAHAGPYTLCYLDLDQFRAINDSLPDGSDHLLQRVAAVVQATAGVRGVAGRVGGDEFAILFAHCSVPTAIAAVEGLCQTVALLPVAGADREISVSMSAGVVGVTRAITNSADLLNAAETACAVAKTRGRGQVQVYQPDHHAVVRYREDERWIQRLTAALRHNQLCLYAQPIRSLLTPETGASLTELLLRLQTADGEIIAPGAFLPAAERYGLMPTIDRWVLHTALGTIGSIRRDFPERRRECYFLNLSASSCDDPSFVSTVEEQCKAMDVPPGALCFEITETAAMADITRSLATMNALRAIGCRLAIDDFGSGFSTFTYLRQLPVQFMKIDGALVRPIVTNAVDYALLEALYWIGNVLGFMTVAEWIEDEATLAAAKAIGIVYGQ